MRRSWYSRPKCEDCQGRLTREDRMRADGICASCFDKRAEAAKARDEKERQGLRKAPPRARLPAHVRAMIEGVE